MDLEWLRIGLSGFGVLFSGSMGSITYRLSSASMKVYMWMSLVQVPERASLALPNGLDLVRLATAFGFYGYTCSSKELQRYLPSCQHLNSSPPITSSR